MRMHLQAKAAVKLSASPPAPLLRPVLPRSDILSVMLLLLASVTKWRRVQAVSNEANYSASALRKLADIRAHARRYGSKLTTSPGCADDECERELEIAVEAERELEVERELPAAAAQLEQDWPRWADALTLRSAQDAASVGVEVRLCFL